MLRQSYYNAGYRSVYKCNTLYYIVLQIQYNTIQYNVTTKQYNVTDINAASFISMWISKHVYDEVI